MNTDKLKPFDLERCKAGDPVVTREGYPFTFGALNTEQPEDSQLIGWVAGRVLAYYSNGQMHTVRPGGPFDLFMTPKEKTIWGAFNRQSLSCICWGYDSFSETEDEVEKYCNSVWIKYNSGDYFFKSITFEI